MARKISHAKRAHDYLRASMEAGYTGLPAAHRDAREQIMAAHERAYPKVREHALAGTDQDFDTPLSAGEREHQRHLRNKEGLTEAQVREIRSEIRKTPTKPSRQLPRVPAAVRRSIGAGRRSINTATPSSAIGYKIAGGILILIIAYVAFTGKGPAAIKGIIGGITAAISAFVAPKDPIATLEGKLGGKTSTATASTGETSGAPTGGGGESGGVSAGIGLGPSKVNQSHYHGQNAPAPSRLRVRPRGISQREAERIGITPRRHK